ncbi:MAG: Sortase family protein [Candidatus Woesebacteria bacterium GW2011_GWA1_39_8]|uniref:Sortase family protein n=1 Tax=Candidatus Woesebacteria bacterium GW2011_GWA1_39_8 TaxID=1618552 RepID=A0A0G0PKJ2_9BACT|nr:MAG: Sortase family protein [Candidatus Woesebacteria bacterium GW2011_GWA1_39_8]
MLLLPLFLRLIYMLLRGLGAGLIGFAVIGLIFSYAPIIKQEISYDLGFGGGRNIEDQLQKLNFVNVAEAEKTVRVQEEAKALGVDSYFSIVIPKIDAASNIIANVDAGNPDEYLAALKKGVAHAKGTYFPGQGKTTYLFSHSTDTAYNVSQYNAVFYLLRKLETGDKVLVFFADKKYLYEVESKSVVEADNTEFLQNISEGERLILQTCDPPGTTWKRLIVVAKPVK